MKHVVFILNSPLQWLQSDLILHEETHTITLHVWIGFFFQGTGHWTEKMTTKPKCKKEKYHHPWNRYSVLQWARSRTLIHLLILQDISHTWIGFFTDASSSGAEKVSMKIMSNMSKNRLSAKVVNTSNWHANRKWLQIYLVVGGCTRLRIGQSRDQCAILVINFVNSWW